MSIEESLHQREISLSSKLRERKLGFDDRTGKGTATERIIEEELIKPFLPPGFDCGKGAVVSGDSPTEQSPAIDRVVYDRAAGVPLVYDKDHSIFPIEIVAGVVEITLHLDATKLRTDIERILPVKGMTKRRFLKRLPDTRTRGLRITAEYISPRAFIVGLPENPQWNAKSIAEALRKIQMDLGQHTHVHGLYVIGIGFFSTIPVENEQEPMYRIQSWTGPDRGFRFADTFRQAFDSWKSLPQDCLIDLADYLSGQPEVLAE